MKKLLLSVALLGSAILGVNAQTLTFLDKDGKTIENGSTFTFEGWSPADIQNGTYVDYARVTINPEISVVSSEDDIITVKTTRIKGGDYQLCAGGDCVTSLVAGPVITKDDVDVLEDEALPLRLEAILQFYDQTVEIPYYEILVEAWSNTEDNVKASFTLRMGDLSQDAAVESIAANGNLVKVEGKTLSYDLNGVSSLNVYSLSGKTVVSRDVAGTGSINLSNLPKGVYIYKVSGKNAKSGKFVIK